MAFPGRGSQVGDWAMRAWFAVLLSGMLVFGVLGVSGEAFARKEEAVTLPEHTVESSLPEDGWHDEDASRASAPQALPPQGPGWPSDPPRRAELADDGFLYARDDRLEVVPESWEGGRESPMAFSRVGTDRRALLASGDRPGASLQTGHEAAHLAAPSTAYTPHAPILIDGNDDFTPENGVTSGSGAWNDPYVIEGWEINASSANGVEIRNTDVRFVLRDLYVHSAGYPYSAVKLVTVSNGKLTNLTVSDNIIAGIWIETSTNVTVSSSNVSSNYWQGIYLGSSTNVTIAGSNVSSSIAYGIWLESSTNVTIAGNNVSDNPEGIITSWFGSSTNVTVAGNNVSDNDFGIWFQVSTNVTVTANDVSNNLWGIRLDQSANVTVASNNISSKNWNGMYGIWIESSTNATIASNNVSSSWYGICLEFSRNATVAGNNLFSNDRAGLFLGFSTNVTVAGNNVSDNYYGIIIDASTNVVLGNNTLVSDGVVIGGSSLPHFNSHDITTDNTINGKPLYFYKDCRDLYIDGIQVGQLLVVNCTGVRVANLHIADADRALQVSFANHVAIISNIVSSNNSEDIYFEDINPEGILLEFSTDVTVAGNNISNNRDGISVRASTNVTVTANDVSNNLWGIRLDQSANVTVASNNVSSRWTGIWIESSTNVTIASSNVSSNYWHGIYLGSSTNVTIAGNNVSSSWYGIWLESSADVAVHHNNIVDNGNQAYDDSGTENVWDDGYPSGGNYWSDYAGVDLYGGPDQDQPGSDGIGDSPYTIDENSQDRYPLMQPAAVDAVQPTVIVTSPTERQIFSTAHVLVSGTASDAGGGGLGRVEVRLNSGTWVLASGTYSWSVSVNLISGSNAIEARAWDNAANPSAITVVNVVYDPEAPTVTIDSPTHGFWSRTATVTLAGTAGDAISGVQRVEVSCDGGATWSEAAGTTAWSHDCILSAGANSIHARSFDNAAWESAHVSIIVYYDPEAPTVTIDSPTDGETFTTTPIEVSGTASDVWSGVSRVEVRVNGGLWDAASGTSSWSLSVALDPGSDLIEARAWDHAGSPSTIASVSVTYSPPPNQSPTPSFVVTPATGNVTTTFWMNASSSWDLEDSTAVLEVRWDWEDDGTWDTPWSTAKTAQHIYAAPGTYTIRLEVKDTGGLTSSVTKQVTVTAVPVDTTKPTLTIASPSSGAVLTSNTVTLSGSSSDDVAVQKVELSLDGSTWSLASGMTSWSGTLTLVEGQNTIYVRVTDTSGNTATTTVSVTVQTPTQGPTPQGLDPMVLGLVAVAVVGVASVAAVLVLRTRRKGPAS